MSKFSQDPSNPESERTLSALLQITWHIGFRPRFVPVYVASASFTQIRAHMLKWMHVSCGAADGRDAAFVHTIWLSSGRRMDPVAPDGRWYDSDVAPRGGSITLCV